MHGHNLAQPGPLWLFRERASGGKSLFLSVTAFQTNLPKRKKRVGEHVGTRSDIRPVPGPMGSEQIYLPSGKKTDTTYVNICLDEENNKCKTVAPELKKKKSLSQKSPATTGVWLESSHAGQARGQQRPRPLADRQSPEQQEPGKG